MKHILFVDDDAAVLAATQRMLRRKLEFWEFRFAQGAREAIHLLTSEHIDAVVTDVAMPGMTGLELLRHITQGPYGFLPVIVVTGTLDKDAKKLALELGAQDLLNKPIDYEDLVARLRNVLALKAYHDELAGRNAQLEDLVARRTEELAASRLELVVQLSKAAELRDNQTGDHVLRVGVFSRAIAAAYGMSEVDCDELFLASTLHDIGKIAVPDAVLRKPGALQPKERQLMESHCLVGHQILSTRDSVINEILPAGMHIGEQPRILRLAADVARSHHEWWDGSGYPDGLKGEEIPLAARIVAIADVLDALRSERPYKPSYDWATSIDGVLKGRGVQFDPTIHDAFLAAEPKLYEFDLRARAKEQAERKVA